MRVVAGVFAVALAAAAASAGPDAPLGSSLDVVVTTEDGRAVGGARVDVFEVRPRIAPGGWMRAYDWSVDRGPEATLDEVLEPEHARRTPDATSTLDADGRTRFDGLAPRRWTFVVTAAGRPVERRTVVVPGCVEPLRVTLADGHALEGRVIDAAGRPFAGALVVASYDAADCPYGRTSVSPFDPWTRADADGRYRFAALPSGAVTIRAAPRGTWRTLGDEVRVPDVRVFNIGIPRCGPIVGTVRDATTSAPVPGAIVEFGGRLRECHARVVADPQGRYEVPVWPDDWDGPAVASAAGLHPVTPEDAAGVTVAAGAPTRVDAFVRPGGTLRGRVLCDARPVADAWVRVGSDSDMIIARTDADGRYATPALHAGGVSVAAFRAERIGDQFMHAFMLARKRGDATGEIVVAVPEKGDKSCDLVLPPPTKPRLRGVVVDPDGEPAWGAVVTAFDGIARHVDDDGFFELSDLGPEPATFTVAADRFVPQRVQAVADAAQPMVVRLAWERTVRVRGVVRTADGESAKTGAVLVVARSKESHPPADFDFWAFEIEARRNAWTPFAADGTFDVVLPVGAGDEIDVAARVPGHVVARRRVLKFPEDGGPIDVPVPLASGATLSGRVVSASTRKPVAGARIRLSLRDVMVIDGPRPSVYATTDGDGGYVVHDLPPVALRATASANGFGRDTDFVDYKPDDRLGRAHVADFALPPPGDEALRGRVPRSDPAGRLIDGPNVPLAGWTVEGYRVVSDERVRATTAADGSFTFGGVGRVEHLIAYPPVGVPGGPRAIHPEGVPSFRDDGASTVCDGSIVAFEVVDETGVFVSGVAYRMTRAGGVVQSGDVKIGAMICMEELAPDARVTIHVEKDGFEPIDVKDVAAGTTRLRLVLKRKTDK